jgi:poly(3-hydroxybutyrate) depolymerase
MITGPPRQRLPLHTLLPLGALATVLLVLAGCACKCPDPASLRGGGVDGGTPEVTPDGGPAPEAEDAPGTGGVDTGASKSAPAPGAVTPKSPATSPPPASAVQAAPAKAAPAKTAPAKAALAKGADPAVCRPGGRLPYDYAAPAVGEKPRIDLAGEWKWGMGWPVGAETLGFDDSKASVTQVPGITRIKRDGKKKTVVWLRRTFEVQRADYFRRQALDLGGRYGASVVYVNGKRMPDAARNGPFYAKGGLPLVDGKNVVTIQLEYSKFMDGIFWYGPPSVGKPTERQRGLLLRRYTSKVDGKPHELSLFVPRCADLSKPMPLILALPGWSGNIWSYSGSELLRDADRRGYLVLTPETFGNILYTGASEDGVMEALDLVTKDIGIDPDRVYITGLSMGGAGALQMAYHYPDRFAAVAAFYGDSSYKLTGYIGRILVSQAQADRYSVINFPENARNLPVLLVHAKDDKTSPFRQSSQLAKADAKLKLPNHRLIAPKRGGHTLDTVDQHTAEAMSFFDLHRREPVPARVTFRTNSSRYSQAYWATWKLGAENVFSGIDAEWDSATGTVHIRSLDKNITAVDLAVPAKKVTSATPITATILVGGKAIEVSKP